MQRPEGSRGDHYAPRPMGEQSRDDPDAPRPMGEQSHGERDATAQQHLYLIFDDWPWGYSIRKLKLPIRSPHRPSLRPVDQRRLRRPEPRQLKHNRLPPPCICLEAVRGHPSFFAAVGSNIIAAHPRKRDPFGAPVPECLMPIVDVSSMGVWFGPGLLHPPEDPIFITVSDVLFALDINRFWMISMDPCCSESLEWSWCDLQCPPLNSIDVTSFAVGDDGRTIFASTNCDTFAFDIVSLEWKQSFKCSLPFIGRANYVSALEVFVGLSNAPDSYGHLCFCRELGIDQTVCKENLFSKDKDSHIAAKLVYLGGSEPWFCIVECVSLECDRLAKCVVDEGTGNCGELDQLKKNVDEGDGASGSMHECGEQDELGSMQDCGELNKFVDAEGGASGSKHYKHLYRLTTFSLSFDNNGDLTTGETCVVQYYKMPEKVSVSIYLNPVAFWL